MRGARVLLLVFGLVAFVVLTTTAWAQPVYPPPTPTDTPTATPTDTPTATPTKTPKATNCANTGRKNNKNRFQAAKKYRRGDTIIVRGGKSCAKGGAQVRLFLEVNGKQNLLGTAKAGDKGTYSVSGKIPAKAPFGDHDIVVKTSGHQYRSTITIVAKSGQKKTSAFGGPMLAAWVALFGVAAAFFVGSRRRRSPVLAVATEAAHPPLLDTSGFAPSYGTSTRASRRGTRSKPTRPKQKAPAKKPSKAKASMKKATSPDAKPATKKKPSAKGRATTTRLGPKAPKTTSGPKAPPRDPETPTEPTL